MTGDIHEHVIETERAGKLNVYVQGSLEQARHDASHAVFLTVHDIGKNHHSWLNFIYHPSMNNIRERAVFIHVDVLGQEDDAPDLTDPTKFPSMQVGSECRSKWNALTYSICYARSSARIWSTFWTPCASRR